MFPAPDGSPVFAYKQHSKLVPLTKALFVHKFRELLARAQVSSSTLFSGHSFRRGGATHHAFRPRVPGEMIQVMGEWKSDAYKRYLEFDFDTMYSVSLHMRDAVG